MCPGDIHNLPTLLLLKLVFISIVEKYRLHYARSDQHL